MIRVQYVEYKLWVSLDDIARCTCRGVSVMSVILLYHPCYDLCI